MIVDGVIFSCAAALAVFIPLRKRYDKRGFFPFSFFFSFFCRELVSVDARTKDIFQGRKTFSGEEEI